jgi:hypothetical protein
MTTITAKRNILVVAGFPEEASSVQLAVEQFVAQLSGANFSTVAPA